MCMLHARPSSVVAPRLPCPIIRAPALRPAIVPALRGPRSRLSAVLKAQGVGGKANTTTMTATSLRSYVHTTDFLTFPKARAPDAGGAEVHSSTHHTNCLIVLNYRLPRCTAALWDQAGMHVCGDGGLNRLYNELPLLLPDEDPNDVRERYLPQIVLGDMDSVDKHIVDFYASRGTKIVNQAEDQDCNDLHKCMRYLLSSDTKFSRKEDEGGVLRNDQQKVFIVGGLGGRMDQEFANLNVLITFQQLAGVLMNDSCFLILLPPGRHRIVTDPAIEGPTCGLVPIMGKARVTTTGLKWNLDDDEMQFGGLISTSNQIEDRVVTVETDQPLIWTTEGSAPSSGRQPQHVRADLNARGGDSSDDSGELN